MLKKWIFSTKSIGHEVRTPKRWYHPSPNCICEQCQKSDKCVIFGKLIFPTRSNGHMVSNPECWYLPKCVTSRVYCLMYGLSIEMIASYAQQTVWNKLCKVSGLCTKLEKKKILCTPGCKISFMKISCWKSVFFCTREHLALT